ncbi:hypothetical protein BX600DRAFT_436313 [Xylariales sp. PMI_506]|nr:hypothetical protein BX600DRAFT_436313 [Xylariales sp. PMI_506]
MVFTPPSSYQITSFRVYAEESPAPPSIVKMGSHEHHLYQGIPAQDIEESSAELGRTIDSKKTYVNSNRALQQRKWWVAFMPYQWILNVALVLVILGLLLERQLKSHETSSDCKVTADVTSVLTGDVTGFYPQFSQYVTTFKPDYSYIPENASAFFSKDVRQRWLDLMPPSLGYVKIEDPDQYNDLPTPLNVYMEQGDFVVSTSVAHQIHCLYSAIEAHAYNAINLSRPKPQAPWHMAHCFEYLRQAILCSSDIALEGQQTTFPEGDDGSDGWDAKHICRDYSQVKDYIAQHRTSNLTWI